MPERTIAVVLGGSQGHWLVKRSQPDLAEVNFGTFALQGNAAPPGITAGHLADLLPVDYYGNPSVNAGDNAFVPLLCGIAEFIAEFIVRLCCTAGKDASRRRLMQLDLKRSRPDPVVAGRVDQNPAVAVGIIGIPPLQAELEVREFLTGANVSVGLTGADKDRRGFSLDRLDPPGAFQLAVPLPGVKVPRLPGKGGPGEEVGHVLRVVHVPGGRHHLAGLAHHRSRVVPAGDGAENQDRQSRCDSGDGQPRRKRPECRWQCGYPVWRHVSVKKSRSVQTYNARRRQQPSNVSLW